MNLLPANLASLANLAATETARYSLTGVYVQFDHDGTYTAVSTDGRCMGITTGPTPDTQEYPAPAAVRVAPNSATSAVIPVKEWEDAFRSLPKERKRSDAPWYTQYLACVPSDKTTLLASTNGKKETAATVENVDGRFPDYRQVIPGAPPASKVDVNPKYLIDLLKTALSYTSDDNQRITLELRGENTPIVVRVNGADGQQFTGLLMPLT